MAHNNAKQPSVESYRTKIINADQQIIQLIAERKGWRKKMLKLEKKQNLPSYDPFKDSSLEKTRTSFAIQYDVSPKLVDQVFNILNTQDLQTADQSF
ncbi:MULTISPECIES: chorismate mutase [unclassified Francisella]|uniref:chorismate mutase n=1 Tax=unclassified Francisella TaxID=2610885 RepID=UPI002E33549B|nr:MULTISPECIES: chorismate mutase [unclassified Francisella]MED7819701.1 chorismate mutase [Francisella sp. 19S2-4]MED7830534.1 chorismate mutase [Francisella sp. 19S2-10]